jgi:chitinase
VVSSYDVLGTLLPWLRINLQILDEYGDVTKKVDGESGCLLALAKLKRQHPHIKTLISVGGGSGSAAFPAVAAFRETREAFARDVRLFCDRYEFNGVDSK